MRLLCLCAFLYLGAILFFVQPRPTASEAGGPSAAMVQEVAGVTSSNGTLPPALPTSPALKLPTAQAPRALKVLEVLSGPGDSYAVVGLLPKDAALDVVGRDSSGAWLAVILTPGSSFHGWVPRSQVSGLTNVDSLGIASITLVP